MNGRWKVACINWNCPPGHPTAPRALTYFLPDGVPMALAERYWPTWAEAIAWVYGPRGVR